MDQDLQELTRQLNKNFEQQEKLLGLFSGMVKTKKQFGQGSGGDDKPEGWFKKAKNSIEAASETMSRLDYRTGRAAESVASKFSLLTKDVGAASDAFQSMAKTLFGAAIGGVLIGGLTRYTTGLNTTYKDMAEHGQTFSDGIFGMARAAMEGKMGLEEYSRFAKKNAAVMSQMSGQGGNLARLSASVRDNATRFGQFGYTVEGLNDLTGDFMETQRLQGRLDKLSNAEARDSITRLAEDTSALSGAFGKSRKEITATAQEAMRSGNITAKLATLTEGQARNLSSAVNSAVTGLSAQAGEAGKLLPQMLADAVSFDGRAFNTELGQTFNAILPEVSTMMGNLAKALDTATPDEALELQNRFVRELQESIKGNMNNLLTMSEAGDANAKQVLRIYQGLRPLGDKELATQRARVQQQEAFTKILGNLEQNWLTFSTGVLKLIYPMIQKPLERIGKVMDGFANSPAAQTFGEAIGRISDRVAAFVESFTSPEKMKQFGDAVEYGLNSLLSFVSAIAGDPREQEEALRKAREAGNTIGSINWTAVSTAIIGVSATISWFGENLQSLAIGLGVVGAAVIGVKAAALAMKGIKWLENAREMAITTRKVIINSGSIDFSGGRGGRGGRDEGRDHGRGAPRDPQHPRGPHGGTGRGFKGRMLSALGLGGAVLAGGGADVLSDALGHVEEHAERQRESTAKANETVKEQARIIDEKNQSPDKVKPLDPKPEDAKPASPKATEPRKAEPARATATEAAKVSSAVDTAEHARPRGALAKIGGFFRKYGSTVASFAKGTGPINALLQGGLAINDLHTQYKRYASGEVSGQELFEEMAREVLSHGGAALGGLIGGGAGGLAGSLVAGPVGGAVGAAGGAYFGSSYGEEFGQSVAESLIRNVKDWVPGTNKPKNKEQGPPQAATLSEKLTKEILKNDIELTDRFKKLEREADTSEDSKVLYNALLKIADQIKEGTAVQAGITNAVVEAIKTGNRSLLNGIGTIGN